MFSVAALYCFTSLPDYRELRERVKHALAQRAIKGTLLLAEEGLNGTIAGSDEALREAIGELRALTGDRLAAMELKFSTASEMPFGRLKVRLKKEIVTLGVQSIDPRASTGTNVEAAEWNALISDPDVHVIDVRNAFEVEIGTFASAIDPHLKRFSDFRAYAERALDPTKQRKVAMFCTGGIRCEKASAYLIAQGFSEVYQLRGEILKYLETVPETDSLWRGACFVFDERVALGHGLVEKRDVQTTDEQLPPEPATASR